MGNPYFSFKQFTVFHDRCAMKVTTDACLFGAWCATEINKKESQKTLLDIGTGSGLLALMIAQKNMLVIDAVEINLQAATQAKQNVIASPFNQNINVYNKDILDFEKGGYDVIISNPPFYENDLQAPVLAKNTAHHNAGLRWDNLFQLIKNKLAPNGTFYLLLPYKRKGELEVLCKENSLFIQILILVKQTPQHTPFRMLLKGTNKPSEITTEEIIICTNPGTYTQDFINLLKDYYLYL